MSIFLVLLLVTLGQSATAETWTFPVRHDHAFGSCAGELTITDGAIRYEAEDGEHRWEWTYPEISSLEILSPSRIRIRSYQSAGALELWREERFNFLVDATDPPAATIDADVFAFLDARSPRPIQARMAVGEGAGDDAVQTILVRHRHRLGGCQGTLSIFPDRIVFDSEDRGDSRTWLLADLESFASTGEFDLRVSTARETYRFDLKLPLGEATYRHLWENVYEPELGDDRGTRR